MEVVLQAGSVAPGSHPSRRRWKDEASGDSSRLVRTARIRRKFSRGMFLRDECFDESTNGEKKEKSFTLMKDDGFPRSSVYRRCIFPAFSGEALQGEEGDETDIPAIVKMTNEMSRFVLFAARHVI